MPILVMIALLLVVTILLCVADALLVSYGECKINVTKDDETCQLTVQGGNYLHVDLNENDISVSSSCGGKATCGYCKVRVLDGGGPILPTEELFMSRQEQKEGMRLACQVKVKNDIDIMIPDFLETVRGMVKNGTFDSKLKWRVKIAEQVPEMIKKGKLDLQVSDDETTLNAMIEEYRDPGGSIVPVLQEANVRYNHLPESFLRFVADNSDVPLSALFRLASFYNTFSLTPTGKYVITICTGTACHVKGAGRLVSMLEDELGIQKETTTPDMLFTLKTVRCIGCCGLAPVIKVGEDIKGAMNAAKTMKMVEEYKTS